MTSITGVLSLLFGPPVIADDDDDIARNRLVASRAFDCSCGVRSGDRTSANPLSRSAETSDRDVFRERAEFPSFFSSVVVPMSMRGTAIDDVPGCDFVTSLIADVDVDVDCRSCIVGIILKDNPGKKYSIIKKCLALTDVRTGMMLPLLTIYSYR